jgi:chromosome segregation ATPase
MGQDPGEVGTVGAQSKSPEQLRREIDQTREELGETAAALGAKTDVKGRAKERVEEIKHNVSEQKDRFAHKASEAAPSSAGNAAAQVRGAAQSNPIPFAAIGALVAGFVLGRLTAPR